MRYEDRRGRRLVFVSHCLLDQNARFPGIAVQEGCVRPLVDRLCASGVGIEQLPCPEIRYWGGVERRLVMPFLNISPRFVDSDLRPPLSWAVGSSLLVYRLLCRLEAWRVARSIAGFVARGYSVAGIVVMNDSPSCGLDRTIDLRSFMVSAARRGVDWSCPTLEVLSGLLPEMLCAGSGTFVGALKDSLGRRGLDILFVGFNPWLDVEAETDRILSTLSC